jgi:hypothetical protein
MLNDDKKYDIEDRLIDFAVRINYPEICKKKAEKQIESPFRRCGIALGANEAESRVSRIPI